MHRFTVLVIFLFSLSSNYLFAQVQQNNGWKLVIAKHRKTYVHLHADVYSERTDSVEKGDVFECIPVDSGQGLYKVWPFHTRQRADYVTFGGDLLGGYMEKENIEFFDSLPGKQEMEIVSKVCRDFCRAWKAEKEDKVNRYGEYEKLNHCGFAYLCIINYYPDYFSHTKDTSSLKDIFVADTCANKGYDKDASKCLAQCLTNNEDIFLAQLKKADKKVRECVVKNTISGLQSFYGDKPKGEGGKRLQYLENKLDAVMGK